MIKLDASRRPDTALSAAPLFMGLEDSALADVLACSRPRQYQAGQLICEEGDPSTRGEQRLVDAVSLMPVPLDAVVEAGADVTVAVNLLGRHTLPAWPGQGPERSTARPHERGVRDTVFEVLELAQLDASARQTAAADVPITPRFGPASWRQMDLGPLFLEAGRRAGEAALPRLAALARPPHAA